MRGRGPDRVHPGVGGGMGPTGDPGAEGVMRGPEGVVFGWVEKIKAGLEDNARRIQSVAKGFLVQESRGCPAVPRDEG